MPAPASTAPCSAPSAPVTPSKDVVVRCSAPRAMSSIATNTASWAIVQSTSKSAMPAITATAPITPNFHGGPNGDIRSPLPARRRAEGLLGDGVELVADAVRPSRKVLRLEREHDLDDAVDQRPEAEGQKRGDEREPGPGEQPER